MDIHVSQISELYLQRFSSVIKFLSLKEFFTNNPANMKRTQNSIPINSSSRLQGMSSFLKIPPFKINSIFFRSVKPDWIHRSFFVSDQVSPFF